MRDVLGIAGFSSSNGRWLLLLSILGSLSCEPSAPPEATVEIVDSAGVSVVTSSGMAWESGDEWRITDRPIHVLGTRNHDESLWRVRGIGRTSDGRIVVLSAGHSEVRVFDAAGEYLRSFGRSGGGPGEFERPFSLTVVAPDTVLVLEMSGIEVFLADGTWVETRTFTAETTSLGPGTQARPSWLATDGSMLGTANRRMDRPTGVYRPPQGMVAFSAYDEPPVLLGWFGGIEQERVDVGGGQSRSIVSPYARSTMGGVGWTDQNRFLVADNTSYEILVYDSAGELHRVIRRDVEPRRVEDGWVEAWKDTQRGMAWTRGQLPQLERGWLNMRVNETVHAFEAVTMDSEDHLWVLQALGDQAETPAFDVFDPDGRFLGEVVAPAGYKNLLAVPLIGPDYLIAAFEDSFGVESVRVYGVTRGD